MIELEVNGTRRTVDPTSATELRDMVQRELPSGHVIRQLAVNGGEFDQAKLDDLEVARTHSVEVRSAAAAEIARESVNETREWIGRICGVLDSIAGDYRLGQEQQGTSRLVDVVDALQVLVALLANIHGFVEVDPARRAEVETVWGEAERELCTCIEGLFAELQSGDAVVLADRTGHTLPAALRRFQDVLGKI